MTNKEFIQKLLNVLNFKTVYMWGTFGSPVTEELLIEKSNQYPNWYNPVRQRLLKSLINKNYFAFDCVGLLKGILWGWSGDKSKYHGGAIYRSNSVPDVNADGMIKKCLSVTDNIDHILPGEAVWMPGHIGVYLGDGKVIESTPRWKNGVQITSIKIRAWRKHGKLPWVKYE